ncbi:MAG: sugar phosphate isomerase/epimerase family protein [Reyranellaceae bacterium]
MQADRLRLALCNEVIADMEFARQCAFSATLGYDGLEVAPFTLAEEPHLVGANARAAVRRAASDAGIAICSLHWLLVKPAGLSITSDDARVRERTLDVMRRLIALCADLGGSALVHGSPAQRRLPEGAGADEARKRGIDAFAAIADDAQQAGVTYCIEALATPAANFVTTLDEAIGIVERIGNPHVRTMLDCSASTVMESEPLAALLDRHLPTGMIAHVQVNDRNRRGPGQGSDPFAPVLAALKRNCYAGWVAAEPFEYEPDGAACAARAVGYLRGIEETLQWRA